MGDQHRGPEPGGVSAVVTLDPEAVVVGAVVVAVLGVRVV